MSEVQIRKTCAKRGAAPLGHYRTATRMETTACAPVVLKTNARKRADWLPYDPADREVWPGDAPNKATAQPW